MTDKFKILLAALADKRKLPVLLLNLDEVSKTAALQLQVTLQDKYFKELDVVLQTPGGDIDAAYLIVRQLRRRANKVNIFVPLYAKSAGTLICLAADKLYLSDLSELGPLDTQIPEEQDGSPIAYISALNGFKALEQVQLHSLETLDVTTKLMFSRSGLKMAEAIHLAAEFTGRTSGQLYAKLDPMKIGEYARALDVGERYGVKVLTTYRAWSDEDARRTVNHLVRGYPHHDYVIDSHELEFLGLPYEEMDDSVVTECLDLRDEMLMLEDDMIILVEPTAEPKLKTPEKNQGGQKNEQKK